MLAGELRTDESRIAQAVFAEEGPVVDHGQRFRRRSGAHPRITGRIELLNDRLHVAGRLIAGDVAGTSRDGEDLKPRIEEGHAERHGIVNAGVAVDNHLAGHGNRPWGKSC
jgi:hypothetical protein